MADTWVSEGTLPGDPLFCDGIEVAVHGDVIAIMAEHFQNTGFDVMIFRPGLAGWDAVGQVTPSLQQAHLSAFPLALDVNGGHVAVGFHAVDHPVTDMGAAFLIEEVNGTWQETARFIANNPATSDGFGRAVAISGDKLYVGAPGRDPDAVIGAGAVYVYDISDCDGDGSPDECPGGCDDPQACGDCNNNGTRDGCDVDCDNNGTPDDCECVPLLLQANIVAPCCKNRFLEVVLPDSCQRAAMRVKMVSLHHPSPPGSNPAPDFSAFEFGPGCIEGPGGCVRWAGPPGAYIESAGTSIWFGAAMLQCQPQYHQWGDMTMTLTGAEIAPSSVYEVQFLDEGCDPSVESNYTSPQTIETDRWGDVEFPYQDPSASDPDQPNVLDLAAIVDKVKNLPLTIPRVKAELSPQLINLNLPANAVDIGAGVDSVKGAAYPFAGPSVCP
jgi:hypothetical protein